MLYAYEDLGEDQFERLIVLLCQRLLGISVKGFAKGPDGGRDAKFVGTAELHPSKAAPWAGTVIVQAKHVNGYNRNFSEGDFYNPKKPDNTVLGKEIIRIRKLREAKQLDHYMLFGNRRLGGNADAAICSYLEAECGIPVSSIYICGVEQLELWLKQFPDVPTLANLDPIDSPLRVGPDELAEVVEALKRASDAVAAEDGSHETTPTDRTSYEEKNNLNNMSPAYAVDLRKRFLKDTTQIRMFLAAPENADVLQLYEEAVEHFQLNIIAKRKDYQAFDEVMNYLMELVFGRSPILNQIKHKRLTRAVLFYMYWNCDIGETADAAA